MHRRTFLRRTAAASAAVAGAVAASTTASAEWREDYPEITFSDELDEVERYQPLLVADHEVRGEIEAIYGFKAEHEEKDTDCYSFWVRHHTQRGLLAELLGDWVGMILQPDGHPRDHEPVLVFTDADTGEPVEAWYATYHHYAGVRSADDGKWVQHRHDEYATHPSFEVVTPWGNYSAVDEDADRDGEFFELKSFLDRRDIWVNDEDVFENTDIETIENPWLVRDREHWWEEGTMDARVGSLGASWGLWGADESDDLASER